MTRLRLASASNVLPRSPRLGAVRQIAWHSKRPFAASGIVDCAGGKVFVKCHDARVRTAGDLAEEHAFMAHLRAAGCAARWRWC